MTHKKQKDKLKYGTTTISYYIIKSERIKTSEIIVDADKVIVRTPLNKNLAEIRRTVSDKASWILRKQKEYKETTPQIVKPSFEEDSTLPYLGKNFPLRILENQPEGGIKLVDGEFIIRTESTRTFIKP